MGALPSDLLVVRSRGGTYDGQRAIEARGGAGGGHWLAGAEPGAEAVASA